MNHEELSKTIQSLKDDLKSAKEESLGQKEITKEREREIENLKEDFKKTNEEQEKNFNSLVNDRNEYLNSFKDECVRQEENAKSAITEDPIKIVLDEKQTLSKENHPIALTDNQKQHIQETVPKREISEAQQLPNIQDKEKEKEEQNEIQIQPEHEATIEPEEKPQEQVNSQEKKAEEGVVEKENETELGKDLKRLKELKAQAENPELTPSQKFMMNREIRKLNIKINYSQVK